MTPQTHSPLRRTVMALLLWSLVVVVATGQAIEPPDVPHLEAAWNAAHLQGDVAALDRLWADELSILVPRMEPMTKAIALEFWQRVPVKFTAYDTQVLTSQHYGETAVVTGKLHRARDFGGRVQEEDWHFTKVYAFRAGAWRVVAYHASEAPAKAPAP